MFEYGTASVLYGEQTLEVACREIAQLGIRHLDLWHIKGWCEHLNGGVDSVRATLERHDMKLEALSAYNTPWEEVEGLIETVRALGGRVLVTGSEDPAVSVPEFAERIVPLVAKAERLGVILAIENHGNAVIDSVESMTELVALVQSPSLGIALAPIHLHRRGEPTAAAIRALKDRIALMYLWDWGPTGDANWKDPAEQFIGTGRIDFRPIFDALLEIGYERPLDVFAHGPEHWPPKKTSEHLRQALETAIAIEVEARRKIS